MRPVLWGLLFAVFCMPLVFVLFLISAAKYTALDALTLKLPIGIRAPVAELALHNVGFGKESSARLDRVIRLDPDSSDAWSRRCTMFVNKDHQGEMAACLEAVTLDPDPWNFNNLGLAQEGAKDYCKAEDSFTTAIQKSSNNPEFIRNMARAALLCGHPWASDAGFETAEGLDAKAAADPDDDGDTKDDLVTDREYLAVVYGELNKPAKAAEVCTRAHPDWKSCHCELNDTGVKCSGGSADPEKKN